ncbi:MAG TPA: hypothetical protein VFI63_01840 [Solirubrobacterales bacterium]|nr:hypothetical protein [Solirubrobacterales bacterium]
MYARVARWEGADAEALERTAAEIRKDAESGPPEGMGRRVSVEKYEVAVRIEA